MPNNVGSDAHLRHCMPHKREDDSRVAMYEHNKARADESSAQLGNSLPCSCGCLCKMVAALWSQQKRNVSLGLCMSERTSVILLTVETSMPAGSSMHQGCTQLMTAVDCMHACMAAMQSSCHACMSPHHEWLAASAH